MTSKIVPICLTCLMSINGNKFITLPQGEHPTCSCHKCGFLTRAGLTVDLAQKARDESAWQVFRLAFLLWVVPAIILYLKSRAK